MIKEGVRLAHSAAESLLADLGVVDTGPSPIDAALEKLGLTQEIVSKQTALPFPDIASTIRGILDAMGKAVYVIENGVYRQRWISAHEIGHYTIQEHMKILKLCNQWDLSPEARKQLEREANEFAAHFLFRGRQFVEECLQSDFSLEMLRGQAERWGVSCEAAFRRFVEQHPDPIALAVCEPLPGPDSEQGKAHVPYTDERGHLIVDFSILNRGRHGAKLKYWVGSPSYLRRYRRLQPGQEFTPDHPVCQAMNAVGDQHGSARLAKSGAALPMSIFFNQYDALVLIGLAHRN